MTNSLVMQKFWHKKKKKKQELSDHDNENDTMVQVMVGKKFLNNIYHLNDLKCEKADQTRTLER